VTTVRSAPRSKNFILSASKRNIGYLLRKSAERLLALRHHEAYTGRRAV
jgi:hypothetical protein